MKQQQQKLTFNHFTDIVNNCQITLQPFFENLKVTIQDLSSFQQYDYCVTSDDLNKQKALPMFFNTPAELISCFKQNYQKGRNKIIIKDKGLFCLVFDINQGVKKITELIECQANLKILNKEETRNKKLERKLISKDMHIIKIGEQNSILKNRVKEYENRWSWTMKHKSFTLLEDNIIEGRSMPACKLALIEKVLPKDRISKWKLKQIIQSSSWSAVGVCLKRFAKKKQYSINGVEELKKLGHGCYLNSWSKYVYSHNDQNFNDRQISTVGFKGQNQIILMQFNPIEETLKFGNQEQGTTFTMTLPMTGGEEYHPCVMGSAHEEGKYFRWQIMEISE